MKKYVSLILAICIMFISFTSSFASVFGDMDCDNEITAADARKVLRASVALEELSDEEFYFADINGDGIITAADARLILRTSVGLEEIKTHNHIYNEWTITKNATCTEAGEKQSVCTCGNISIISIPELQHNFADGKCTDCQLEDTNEVTLPRLDFTGNISEMTSKKDVREIAVTYTSKDISFAGAAKLKLQGTSSLSYPKKNFTINLYEDNSLNTKMKIDTGWGAQSKYCLKANYIDFTHSRNIITANIAAELQHKYGLLENTPHNGTIDGFPIEVYANGEFLGIYTFNIPKDAWMFNMDEDNPNHIVFCNEGYEPANLFNAPADFDSWSLEVGEETDEKLQKLNELISFVKYSTDDEFRKNFEEHLNLDSTLNYFILTEFAYLRDNQAKNMLLVTYDGKLWYPSLYDLDTCWGTYWDGTKLFDYETTPIDFTSNTLWNRFTTLFSDEIKARYAELRDEFLKKEIILGKFESFIKLIPEESFIAENNKWGQLPGYGIEQIEEFLDYMIPVLDEKYGYHEAYELDTKENIVKFYCDSYNNIKNASAITRTYEYYSNYNDILDCKQNSTVEDLAELFFGWYLTKDETPVEVTFSDLPPTGSEELNIEPSLIADATIEDMGEYYVLTLYSTGTDDNYEINSVPVTGSAGSFAPIVNEEDIYAATSQIVTPSDIELGYSTATVTAEITKDGKITKLSYSTPCVIKIGTLSILNFADINNCSVGILTERIYEITY